jgi:cysteine synthase B
MLKAYRPITKYETRPERIRSADVNLLSVVGNTPLLALERIPALNGVSPKVKVLAKAEWFNPGGSVKDRPARNILTTALADGQLGNGKRLLDSTSGNMGIAYATFGARLGVPVTLVVPENASPERIKILQALGAEIVLSDPLEGSDGAIQMAQAMAEREPARYWYANQYSNPANWQAHYKTTAPEIIQQSAAQTGRQLTHFVAGLGTSGTMMGVGRYLHAHAPAVRLIAFQPDSPFHGLEGLKHMESAIRPAIYDSDLIHDQVTVATEAAYDLTLQLAREEGLFTGISSGAAALAAIQVARELDEGVVVTIFPDAGYKYLSDSFWEQP